MAAAVVTWTIAGVGDAVAPSLFFDSAREPQEIKNTPDAMSAKAIRKNVKLRERIAEKLNGEN